MNGIRRFATRYLALLAWIGIGFIAAGNAQATTSPILASGGYTYSFVPGTSNVVLTVGRLDNLGIRESGELQMEFWALPAPFLTFGQTGYDLTGYRMAVYPLGRIAPGYYILGVNSGQIPYTLPPPGTWYFVTIITEYDGSAINDGGWIPAQFNNFPGAVTIAPPAFTGPANGLYFDPTQPTNGYSVVAKGGSVTVVTYTFTPTGAPQWYISTGALTGGGKVFTGTLDKYEGGPCVPCDNTPRFATSAGNDGPMTIVWTTNTSAVVTLPGGRVANIVLVQ